MKKFIGLLLLLVTFASCEGTMGPEGPMGPQGPAGEDGTGGVVEGWLYHEFEITSEEWQLSADGTYFWCEKPWDDITDYVFQEGMVIGNMYTKVGTEWTLTPLPYVLDCKDGDYTWQETYTLDYSPGWVAFYISYDDFQMDMRPNTQQFRVTILW